MKSHNKIKDIKVSESTSGYVRSKISTR